MTELDRRHFLGLLGGGAASLAFSQAVGVREESADKNNDALEIYDFVIVIKSQKTQRGELELRVTMKVTYRDTGIEQVFAPRIVVVGDVLELSGQMITDLWSKNG